jgi:transposase
MNQRILFIAVDVDDKNFTGYALCEGAEEDSGQWFKCKPNVGDLKRAIEKITPAGYTVHICYESTYCGFHLCRALRQAGYECDVMASGLIPEKPADRVKNDRLDAKKLAVYFSRGLLTSVYVPEVEDEQDRMILRSRYFLKEQLKATRKHVIFLCKQLGWSYRQEKSEGSSYWTGMHRNWMDQKLKTAAPVVQKNFEILFSQLDSLEARIEEYNRYIEKIAETEKYTEKVKALKCYRGIDILSAMTLITEIGNIRRFSHPNQLSSYVGLDIAEYSSGGKERRFSISKMGNNWVRRTIVESNQNVRHKPIVSRVLKLRRSGVDLKYIDVADRCMKRLNKKYLHLLFKGKQTNKIKVACAREMLGFIWESLNLAN